MNIPTSSDTFISLVDSLGPTVVRVEAPRQPGTTGLWWSEDGLVITAHHALRRDEGVRVSLGEGPSLEATVLGRDPATDLVLLRVDVAGPSSIPSLPKWREASTLGVGELGLALARPGRTVRAALALVAVVGETLETPQGRSLAPYVELDRSLPHGFSVAPVVDLKGQVLGLSTAGLARETTVMLGLDTVRAAVEAIAAHGHVPQGYLGVGVAPARLPSTLKQSIGQGRGLAIVGLAENGPAAKGGVLVGDVILSVDGAAVRSPSGLRAQLSDRAGQAVDLRLLRGGQTTDLQITAGERQ